MTTLLWHSSSCSPDSPLLLAKTASSKKELFLRTGTRDRSGLPGTYGKINLPVIAVGRPVPVCYQKEIGLFYGTIPVPVILLSGTI